MGVLSFSVRDKMKTVIPSAQTERWSDAGPVRDVASRQSSPATPIRVDLSSYEKMLLLLVVARFNAMIVSMSSSNEPRL
jgi:hypothetical protein